MSIKARQASYLTNNKSGLSVRAGFEGACGKVCQFIKSNPTADDSCKCGQPTVNHTAWCDEHFEIVYNVSPRDKAREFSLATTVCGKVRAA